MTFPGFRPAALAFLRDLGEHNTRPWFEAHRDVYEREIREPMGLLVEEVDARLGIAAPEFTGTPKRNIYRIHRDTRFSKDKSPYKTNAACWWGHRDAARRGEEGSHAGSGLYFELNPTGSFAAGGTWMPARHTLAALREAIAEGVEGFEATMATAAFRKTWKQLDEEAMLTRLPRGFAPGHPAERWLRYQSFTVTAAMPRREVLSKALPDLLVEKFASLLPLVRWLNAAQGLKAAKRR